MINWSARHRPARAAALFLGLALLGCLCPHTASAADGDERAWELVTFERPASSELFGLRPLGQSGERLAYGTLGPPPGSASGSLLGSSIAMRGSNRWLNFPLGPAYFAYSDELFDVLAPSVSTDYSDDLQSSAWIASVPLTEDGPEEGELGVYRMDPSREMHFIAAIGEGLAFQYPGLVDLSADGARLAFTTENHLLASDAGRSQGSSVYAWDGADLHHVDTASGGGLLSSCGSEVSRTNGVSASGTRVFFTHPAQAACGVARVYLRDLSGGDATEISASSCTRVDCNAPQAVTFAGATPDGGAAYLTTVQQLTDEDTDSSRDLYRYDLDATALELLTPGPEGQVSTGKVYPSDDGRQVYFRASGKLLPDETATGEKLYLADEDGLRLVAVATFPGSPQIQVSADGEVALFVTQSKVDAADTDTRQDAYLFNAELDTVTRISSSPSGGNGNFDASVQSNLRLPEFETGDERVFHAIDAAGDRVVFSTKEALSLADSDANADLYEWRADGLTLITPGNDDDDSEFGGMSRDGRTVIFATSESLTANDLDAGEVDLYAARQEGGFPAEDLADDACDCPPSGEDLTRPIPASSLVGDRPPHDRIRVLGIRTRQGGKTRHVVGRVTVVHLFSPVPGRASAQVSIGRNGKRVVLARGSARVRRGGKVRLVLRLTAAGKRVHRGSKGRRARLRLAIRRFHLTKAVRFGGGGGRHG